MKNPAVHEEALYQVIVGPRISEKSASLADRYNQVAFQVRRDSTKPAIRAAVEKMFNVQVESVTVANVKGKAKGSGKTRGRRSDWKKAYVRLKPGQEIDFVGNKA